jgi:hypothetical protein
VPERRLCLDVNHTATNYDNHYDLRPDHHHYAGAYYYHHKGAHHHNHQSGHHYYHDGANNHFDHESGLRGSMHEGLGLQERLQVFEYQGPLDVHRDSFGERVVCAVVPNL